MRIMQKSYYYHLTSFEKWAFVQNHGLKAGENGYIYLLDTKDVDGAVAFDELGLFDFAVFRIDPEGIKSPLIPDKSGEWTDKHQFKVKQNLIKPKYVKFLGMKRILRHDEIIKLVNKKKAEKIKSLKKKL